MQRPSISTLTCTRFTYHTLCGSGKRHPTICDGAIIGSGAQVLGPVIVGARARVGANAVVTRDVPEGVVMVGIPARKTLIDAQEYQRHFVPYGTPCTEAFDPETQKQEIIQCEHEQMRKRIAELMEERSDKTNDPPANGMQERDRD